MLLECDLSAFGVSSLVEHIGLSAGDPLVTNAPDCQPVVPQPCVDSALKDSLLSAQLKPPSWNVLRIQVGRSL